MIRYKANTVLSRLADNSDRFPYLDASNRLGILMTAVSPTALPVEEGVAASRRLKDLDGDWSAEMWWGFVLSAGLERGYPDEYLRGRRPITRAELATVVARFLLKRPSPPMDYAAAKFRDVEGSEWWFGAAFVAASSGVMRGYPDGTFRGRQPVTMDEFIVTIARLMSKLDQEATPSR